MTNQEFRVKTLGLFAKAEYINDNLEFAKNRNGPILTS